MSDTPVPQGFKFSWSYSSTNAYSICPRKYYAEKIAKTAPFEQNEQAAWGLAVHKSLELAARDGVPLPSNMVQYQPTLDKVKTLESMALSTEYERQFAVDKDWKQVSWFSKDTWGRAISDVFVQMDAQHAIVLDYKTGKPPYMGKVGLQPVANARVVFAQYPQVETVDTSFIYLAHGQTFRDTFHRHSMDHDFQPVAETIYRMQQSIEHHNFPATKNFLCRAHCADHTCPHNGRKA